MVTERQASGGIWLVEPPDPREAFTPERFSDEHRMIAQTVRTFLAQEIAPLDTRLEQKDLALMRGIESNAPASSPEDLLPRAKTVVLACLGRAMDRWGAALDDQQEVLGWLSDQIIQLFAVESGSLRAVQAAGTHGEPLMREMVREAAGDLAPEMARLAARVLGGIEDGVDLDRDLAGVRALLGGRPANTIAARRTIADRVIEAGGYPCGLPPASA